MTTHIPSIINLATNNDDDDPLSPSPASTQHQQLDKKSDLLRTSETSKFLKSENET